MAALEAQGAAKEKAHWAAAHLAMLMAPEGQPWAKDKRGQELSSRISCGTARRLGSAMLQGKAGFRQKGLGG